MQKRYELPRISAEEATPLVMKLVALLASSLEQIECLKDELQQMRDEIAVLKGQKAKPKFKSGKMDQNTDKDDDDEVSQQGCNDKKKRPGSAKRSKTAQLVLHEE